MQLLHIIYVRDLEGRRKPVTLGESFNPGITQLYNFTVFY